MRTLATLVSSGGLFLTIFTGVMVYIGFFRPSWFKKWMMLYGTKDVYEAPFYPFKRWTWQEPPENWRSVIRSGAIWMVVFGATAFCLAFTHPRPWGFIGVPLLMSMNFMLLTLRIFLKVQSLHMGRQSNANKPHSPDLVDSAR